MQEISDSQLMVLEMYIAREGENKHNLPITRDAIIDSADTIIGKPVLFRFNNNTQDVMGHEPDEIACGVTALTADDYYFKEVDGKLWLVCKAYIWKMYFEEIVDVFERDKEKAISMEMLLVDSEDDENEETLITQFVFTGVTLLGNEYSPAIPEANSKVLRYSKKNFSNLVEKTKQLLFAKKSTNKEENELNKKFDKEAFAQSMKLTANQMFEMFEKELSQFKCKMGSGEDTYECKKYFVRDFCGNYVYARDYEQETMVAIPYAIKSMKANLDFTGVKYARMTYMIMEDDEEKEEDVVKTFEDKAVEISLAKVKEDNEAKVKEFSEKITNLEKDKTELDEKVKTFEASNTELTDKLKTLEDEKAELITFKENIIQQEKEQKVNFAIESVKDSLNEKQINEWKNKVDEFDNIDSFTNAIQAFAYTQVKKIKPNDEEMRIHIPKVENKEKTKKGLWE